MIQNLANTGNAAIAARRALTADTDQARSARPQPAAQNDGAVVQLASKDAPLVTGGFGLDLAYSRQLIRQSRGQAPQVVSQQNESLKIDFRFATTALPRGEDGSVNLEELANTDEKNALSSAIDGLKEHGLKDPGALASFVSSVDDLFREYEQDLGMQKGDLSKAKSLFVDEVKSFFAHVEEDQASPMPAPQAPADPNAPVSADPNAPAPSSNAPQEIPSSAFPRAFMSLDAALSGLRDRLASRRQDVLTAAGDLSKVLAERTAEALKTQKRAPNTEEDRRAAGRLGDLLSNMKDAQARRSTKDLRDQARNRLMVADDKLPERVTKPDPTAAAVELGRSFLQQLPSA